MRAIKVECTLTHSLARLLGTVVNEQCLQSGKRLHNALVANQKVVICLAEFPASRETTTIQQLKTVSRTTTTTHTLPQRYFLSFLTTSKYECGSTTTTTFALFVELTKPKRTCTCTAQLKSGSGSEESSNTHTQTRTHIVPVINNERLPPLQLSAVVLCSVRQPSQCDNCFSILLFHHLLPLWSSQWERKRLGLAH